jgi:hypothetical protein
MTQPMSKRLMTENRSAVVLRPVTGETATQTTARIQAALDATTNVTLHGGDFLTNAPCRLNDNQTFVLHDARLIRVSDGATGFAANSQVITNKNINGTGNTGIRVRGHGRAVIRVDNPTNHVRNTQGLWPNIGVAFVGVTDSSVTDVTIGPTQAFAANMQLCSDIRWARITLAQDGTTPNQDGIDTGPGCSNIKINDITGRTGDDLFSIYAQSTSSSIEQAYVKAYLLADATRCNISAIHISSCRVRVGINPLRLQAGDGGTLDGVTMTDVTNTSTTGGSWTLMQVGDLSYVTTAPTRDQLKNITIDGYRGAVKVLIGADGNFSNVVVRNVELSGAWDSFLRPRVNTAFVPDFENVLLEGITTTAASGGGQLVYLSGTTTTQTADKLTIRNCKIRQCGSILFNTQTLTNVKISGIHIHRATNSAISRSPTAETGWIDSVSIDAYASGSTPRYSGTACKLIHGGGMPLLTSVDVAPAPTKGSKLISDGTADPTGNSYTTSEDYIGVGTVWVRPSDIDPALLPEAVAVGGQSGVDFMIGTLAFSGSWAPTQSSTAWGGGSTKNTGPALTNYIEFQTGRLQAGTYTLELYITKGPTFGIATVALAGSTVGTVDFYAASGGAVVVKLTGIVVATGGSKALRFTVTGANGASATPFYTLALTKGLFVRTA